jgi:septal ring factor EnvC (AmiA/AmiB activator)
MKLLRTFLFVLAGFLAGCTAWAADEKAPKAQPPSIEPQVQSLKEKLSLSDQQTQELDATFKDTKAKTDALRKQIQALNKQKREKIDSVLTAEQKKKLEVMNSEPPPELTGAPPRD